MNNIALIGPPGVGKGKQADRLHARQGWHRISTGNLLRENLAGGTDLGLRARQYMDEGDLVPDSLVDAMIAAAVARVPAEESVVFDGFPRTVDQAMFLDALFQQSGRLLDAVIYLRADDALVTERLAGRQTCPFDQTTYHATLNPAQAEGLCDLCAACLVRRDDDCPELIAIRLGVFHRVVERVADHYAETGKLFVIDGSGSVEDVAGRLDESLEAIADGSLPPATTADIPSPVRAAPPLPAALRATVDIVLFGGPGSGKGTQAEYLCRELSVGHIATGDLFRTHLSRETRLGKLAKGYMERGELVPDHITESMVQERLREADVADGFVLDGFPRSLHQAEALAEILHRLGRALATVIYIRVSDEEIVRRLSGRWTCRRDQSTYHTAFKPPRREGVCDLCGDPLYQRADDSAETIRARLDTFHAQTQPLVAYYEELGLLRQIDGEGSLQDVAARCLAAAADLGACEHAV